MVYRKNPLSRDELRELALKRLEGQARRFAEARTLPEMQQVIEELEIHQIELEMQNVHLGAARSQLELALGQSSEIYDFSPVGSLLLDPTGAITKLNLAAASLLGGSRSRLLGSRLGLYVAEEHRLLLNAVLDQAMASGDVQGGELSLARIGLRSTPVSIRVAALPDALGWQVILMDISDRKLIEERLRASEERLALALESVGDGVWDWNVQTGELVLSKRFSQLYGFAEDEYGRHMEDLMSRIHPDDKPRVMDALQSYLGGQSASFSIEHRGYCKGGGWKWVLSRGAVVSRSADGRVLRMIGTHVDISAKKQAEESLRVASQFQQAVFDAQSAHLLVLDRHGNVIQTNAAWRQYARDNGCPDVTAHIGVNYLELLGCLTGENPETVQLIAAGIASVASGELPHFQLPQPFYAPSDRRWFTLKVTPVHDDERRLVVSHEDVSSLKAAELSGKREVI